MTWQEELRKLDSALAGGELSANQYRKRRDDILAATSSAQPPSAVIGPPTGPRPVLPAEGDNGEVTQIVNTSSAQGQGTEADNTQIISDPAGVAEQAGTPAEPAQAERTQAISPAAERTQVVSAADQTQIVAAVGQYPQQAQQNQAPWATTRPDPGAPTGAFPQLPQPMLPPAAVTPTDAQNLFTSNKPARGNRKPWLIGVVVLVVLALVGAGVWFFALRDDNGQNTADTPTSEQQTGGQTGQEPPPEVDITGIALPGNPMDNNGEKDVAEAGDQGVIAPAEATLLADAGVGSLVFAGSAEGNYSYLLYSYASDDAAAAKERTSAIEEVQRNIGLLDSDDVSGVADGVIVTELANSTAATMRGLYTYGDRTFQLCVLQNPLGDETELRNNFVAAMKIVTDAAPPAG